MLGTEQVDHVGIRVSDKSVSIAFHARPGVPTLSDTGFEEGHSIVMRHPSSVVTHLRGSPDMPNDKNVLMDMNETYAGTKYVSFKVASIDDAWRSSSTKATR